MSFKPKTFAEALEKQRARKKKKEQRCAKKISEATSAGKKRIKTRNSYRSTSEYLWKKAVRLRDNYQCQYLQCKVKSKHIHCHHIAPRSQRKDLIYVVANGIALCAFHHNFVHSHPVQAIAIGLLSNRSRELSEKEGTLGIR